MVNNWATMRCMRSLLDMLKVHRTTSPRYYRAFLSDFEEILDDASHRLEQAGSSSEPRDVRRHQEARIYHAAAYELEEALGPIAMVNSDLDQVFAKIIEYAGEASERLVSRTKEDIDKVLDDCENNILADIRKTHETMTGIKDTFSHVKKKLRGSTGDDDTFLGKIMNRYMNEKKIRLKIEGILNDQSLTLESEWKQFLLDLNEKLSSRLMSSTWWFDHKMADTGMVLGDEVPIGLAVLGAGAGATAILAAGWHTMIWAAGNVFLPFLPIAVLATIGTAWLMKGRTQKKYEDASRQVVKTLRESVELWLERDVRKVSREKHYELLNQLRDEFVKAILGDTSLEASEQIAEAANKQIRFFREEARKMAGVKEPATVDATGLNVLMEPERIAKQRFASGDLFAAAVFASLGFENLIKELRAKHAREYDLASERFFKNFIESLYDANIIPEETARKLTYLRRRRNEVIHNIDRLALMNEQARKNYVSEFLDLLDVVRLSLNA